MYKTRSCGTLRNNDRDAVVTVAGWLGRRRDHGGLIFIDLRDSSGVVQLVLDPHSALQAHAVGEQARAEWVLQAQGKVRLRPEDARNPSLDTGEIEIEVTQLKVLSKALTPPFEVDDEDEVNEELRLEYRFLDLRRPKMQKNLRMRHQISKLIWDHLSDANFVQVETPLLLKSTPEGARDYIVPSRTHPGKFYALPQSPQQLKQILMASGVERYFQLARCLRDEDLRADRQPEHTQLDLEMSWVHQKDVLDVVERLYATICQTVRPTMRLKTPFEHLTYANAMQTYGTDKPDLRFGLQLCDLKPIAKASGARLFADGLAVDGIVSGFASKAGSQLKRRELDGLVEHAKQQAANGLIWVIYENHADLSSGLKEGDFRTSLARFITAPIAEQLAVLTKAEAGDLVLIVSGKKRASYTALASLRNLIGERQRLADANELRFVWVTDFPMFEWDLDNAKWEPAHHLFSAPFEEDISKLDSAPGEVRAQLFDLVCNGVELGSGSIRINQRDLQQKVFNVVGYSNEQVDSLFEHLLKAFDYGTPPHGGMGLGLDRLVALMAGEKSIREVIAFPKTQKATDVLFRAPDDVGQTQLRELGIQLIERPSADQKQGA